MIFWEIELTITIKMFIVSSQFLSSMRIFTSDARHLQTVFQKPRQQKFYSSYNSSGSKTKVIWQNDINLLFFYFSFKIICNILRVNIVVISYLDSNPTPLPTMQPTIVFFIYNLNKIHVVIVFCVKNSR